MSRGCSTSPSRYEKNMNNDPSHLPEHGESSAEVNWKPLNRIQRRVAGVLVEKSKTTPDIYPMSINAIKTGSNQKSNRSPQMDLREEEVDDVLYELRAMGAVIEVHSGGRVPKYKHQLYEWLGVEKVELAVMAELLLRGEQTLGDLRARASRMDRINGQEELRPIIASLIEKNLIVELTPPGRGQIVTHNLYQADEMKRLELQFDGVEASSSERGSKANSGSTESASEPAEDHRREDSRVEALVAEVQELRQIVEGLSKTVAEIQELL